MAFGFWLRKPLAACVLLAAVPALAQEPAYDDGGAGTYAGESYAAEGGAPPAAGGMLGYGGMQGYPPPASMGAPNYDAYGMAMPGCAQGCMPGCESPEYPAALPVWFGRGEWLYWTRDVQTNG